MSKIDVLVSDHRKMLEEIEEQFINPIAQINIETGEGYCRIKEIWEQEGMVKENT